MTGRWLLRPLGLVLVAGTCGIVGCRSVVAGDIHCKKDHHCPPGWYCGDDGLCEQDCDHDADCGSLEYCDETGQCQDLPDELLCPYGTGWPCTCIGGECEDGTPCLALEDLADGGVGVCMAACDCESMPQGCPSNKFELDSRCGAYDSVDQTCRCLLADCVGDDQCPPGQSCQLETHSGKMICHP